MRSNSKEKGFILTCSLRVTVHPGEEGMAAKVAGSAVVGGCLSVHISRDSARQAAKRQAGSQDRL